MKLVLNGGAMKNYFYGTFVSGMQEIIAGVVRERLRDVSILKLLDGAILFETDCTYDRLNFFCFNNIFSVIDIHEHNRAEYPAGPLELHISKILAANKKLAANGGFPKNAWKVISENNKKIKTFRLVCSLENRPASINDKARRDMEAFIVRASALQVDRSNPDTEFSLLYRREGFSIFMKRLTWSVEKKLYPGELSPQLAWLLCRTGMLKSNETVIDPFCGYGSIPEAAVKHFPIKKFYALDKEPRCVKITSSKAALKSDRCEIRAADIFSLSETMSEGSIDAVITDPPWGIFKETSFPLEEFYEKTLTVFCRLLKSSGRCVILTGARREFEKAAAITLDLPITQIIPILVSGKKAAVYVMKKKAGE